MDRPRGRRGDRDRARRRPAAGTLNGRARLSFLTLLTGGVLFGALAPAVTAPLSAPKPTPSPGPSKGAPAVVKHGDQIVLHGNVLVRKGESVGSVVMLHGTAVILGLSRGDVVVVRGSIDVSGTVEGDVVALDGPVTLRAGSHVTGDVWVPHGKATVQVGARIDGHLRRSTPFKFLTPASIITKLAVWIAITVSTLLLGLLLVWLVPRGADAVYAALRERPGASIGWGLGAFFGLPAVGVLLVVTLVGIPFGVGLLLALAFLYSVGYVWAAWVLGRWIVHPGRHGYAPRRLPAFLAGWAIMRALGFVPVLGAITFLLGSALGLGLMTVATWRARRRPSSDAAAPALASGTPPSGATPAVAGPSPAP